MRKPFSNYFLARILSLAALAVVLTILVCFGDESYIWKYLCLAELAAITLLLMHPLSYEDIMPSLRFELAALPLLASAYVLTIILCIDEAFALMLPPVLLLIYKLFRSRLKHSQIRLLFRRDSVWCGIEDTALDIYGSVSLTAFVLVICFSILDFGEMCFLAIAIFLALLFYILYRRAYTGRTMFLSSRDEEQVQAIIRNNLRSDLRPEETDEYMKCLYDKAVHYMETDLPFLDPDFTQDTMAKVLFSNKMYLSRAINAFSGFNFRQFVNYYRINYSLALVKEDPNLTVSQLAYRSGFHSVVTYNLAFKMHKRTTPGEYFRENYSV